MKKITLFLFLIIAMTESRGQNFQITFAGSGASTTVDSVKVENLTKCTKLNMKGSDILHLTPTAGINEINLALDQTVSIFPNPMEGNCSVDFELAAQDKTTIALFDLTGKRICQVQEFLQRGQHTYSISGTGKGIFILKIETEKYSYTTKLISIGGTGNAPEIKKIETRLSEPSSITRKEMKTGKSLVDMQFNTGDRLKLTGKSGACRTVYMIKPIQNETVTFNFVACTDADNNNYPVVQIGTAIWMAENLNATKYRNGDAIPNVTDNVQWLNLTTGAYCNYNNNTNNSKIYGRLYNFYTITDTRNISPVGWHVATDTEWTALATTLNGDSVAGGKLKEICASHWQNPNFGATNETGFTALPGGCRKYSDAYFINQGTAGFWFTATEYDLYNVWLRNMHSFDKDLFRDYTGNKVSGYSIRCVKD